jgi:hypothetical protein
MSPMAAVAEVIAGGSLNLPLQSRLTAVLDATLAQLRNILSLSTRVVAKQHQQHAMPTVCTHRLRSLPHSPSLRH